MKLITAIIKPFKLDEVRQALRTSAFRGRARTGETGARTPFDQVLA